MQNKRICKYLMAALFCFAVSFAHADVLEKGIKSLTENYDSAAARKHFIRVISSMKKIEITVIRAYFWMAYTYLIEGEKNQVGKVFRDMFNYKNDPEFRYDSELDDVLFYNSELMRNYDMEYRRFFKKESGAVRTIPPEHVPVEVPVETKNYKFKKNDFGLGLNYFGLSARYFFSEALSCEVKGSVDRGVSMGGLRVNYYTIPEGNILLLLGCEADYIIFKGDESKGNGYYGSVYIGGEAFVSKNISVQIDIGPSYTTIKDKETKLTQNGVDIVANIGLNYYFWK